MGPSRASAGLWAAGGYALVFTVLGARWLASATHAVPAGAPLSAEDARLIVWALAWTSHALATDPRHLFDANIFHPAPGQLTGSEYYASSQLAVGPFFWATGNAVLAANLGALLSYPLAALAMERLLSWLGCGRLAAWVGGLVFALGPLRVPGNLQIFQYQSLYLPLAALSLSRLRDRPTVGRALAFGAVFTLGLFSSYYMALLLSVTAAVWAALELASRGPGRYRFALLSGATAVAGLAVLAGASGPYLARHESSLIRHVPTDVPLLLLLFRWAGLGAVPLIVAAGGILALLRGPPSARLAARRGVLVAAVGVLSMLGPGVRLGSWTLPMPFAMVVATPAAYFRSPMRFVVVFGFGMALLAGAALEAARRHLGRWIVALAAVALVITHGARLSGVGADEVLAQRLTIYDDVARAARDFGGGPILELPLRGPGGRNWVPDSMVGSTRHWQPLIVGFTGYLPPHHSLLLRVIDQLPAPHALADLVDMTHLRWILLRPPEHWQRPELRDAILHGMQAEVVTDHDGWVLARVTRRPEHPEWFAALAAGPREGFTVLGTSLAPLAPEEAVSRIRAAPPREAKAGSILALGLTVRNLGRRAWPVSVPLGMPPDGSVDLVSRWRRTESESSPAATLGEQRVSFQRDVSPGEAVRFVAYVLAPREPGRYELAIDVEQVAGRLFDGPGNMPLRAGVVVARD